MQKCKLLFAMAHGAWGATRLDQKQIVCGEG